MCFTYTTWPGFCVETKDIVLDVDTARERERADRLSSKDCSFFLSLSLLFFFLFVCSFFFHVMRFSPATYGTHTEREGGPIGWPFGSASPLILDDGHRE